MNNYEQLLPKGKITNWKSSQDKCCFKLQNVYTLELIHDHSTENNIIHIKSGPASPFTFDLDLYLKHTEKTTIAQLKCSADINPILKMIIEKPLNNLFDYMADRLAEIKS